MMGLDSVQVIINVEMQYGFDISDADARTIRSVGDLHAYILNHAEPRPEPATAWAWLVNMFEEEFGVARDRIRPEARIVDDLGID